MARGPKERAEARAAGKLASEPAGHQEVRCGTVSFYNAQGERLSTAKFARMPEHKKATLKEMLDDRAENLRRPYSVTPCRATRAQRSSSVLWPS